MDAFRKFDEELSAIEDMQEEITINIMSDGGDASIGLAFYDRIKNAKAPITTVAYGLVASAATIVFLAGKNRHMTKNSCLFFHEEICSVEDLPVAKATQLVNRCSEVDNQYNVICEAETGVPKSIWEDWNSKDTYLNPNECLANNICHKIL